MIGLDGSIVPALAQSLKTSNAELASGTKLEFTIYKQQDKYVSKRVERQGTTGHARNLNGAQVSI